MLTPDGTQLFNPVCFYAATAEAFHLKCKCTGESNKPRPLFDKRREPTRVNICAAFPRWRASRGARDGLIRRRSMKP